MTITELKVKALDLPQKPGVYIMKDKSGEIIYVGKAKQLKNRVTSYFRETGHDIKTAFMVSKVFDFDFIIANSEFDALVTENSLIKLHKPRYNILLKDDKGFPYARVNTKDEYPRFKIESKPRKDGAKYLGPFSGRTVLAEAIDAVLKALKLPTCSRRFPAELKRGRPCLNLHMGLCSGFCRGEPDSAEYQNRIHQAVLLLDGKSSELRKELQTQMDCAAEELRFEQAAELRDRLKALTSLFEKHIAVPGTTTDLDVIGFYRGEAKSCFVALHYSEGKFLGKEYEIIDNPLEDDGDAVSALTRQFYRQRESCPKTILLPVQPDDMELLERLFSETYDKRVYLLYPQKGDRRKLVETACDNAREECDRVTSKLERISKTIELLQKTLGLSSLPKRIEACDISNTGDADIVGSLTVFENSKPLKRDYRRFKIKANIGQDDYHSMQELLTRRFARYMEGDEKFASLPDLLLVDGGETHAAMASKLLSEMSIEVPVYGMVKDDKHKTRALISPDGLEISLSNPAVFALIGRIQEETHRFAIEYHRTLRSKNSIGSVLDNIEGIGEARRSALLKRYKSIKAIENASVEELSTVVPKKAAQSVYDYFKDKKETTNNESNFRNRKRTQAD